MGGKEGGGGGQRGKDRRLPIAVRAQELCERRENRGGHPALPVPNNPYGLCGRKANLEGEEEEVR